MESLVMFAAGVDPAVPIGAEHLEQATSALWAMLAAVVAFFVIRPELWRRLWLERIDPRGAALTRIAVGITVLWTWIDLAVLGEFLFTDQGLWLTDMARKNYGGRLATVWDPVHGFEHWYDVFRVFGSRWTVLHVRSDPAFVYTIFGLLYASAVCMTLGWRTRLFTFLTWVLMLQLYNYSPIFYAGGDTVLKAMMFLAVFTRWGEAYSIDTWRRRRRTILAGAEHLPGLRKIPAWPLRMMMLQLTVIYVATGLLKSGETWWSGSALYYALNLDHFYRVPATGFVTLLHQVGLAQLSTHVVHWWEMLFFLAPAGVALQRLERDRERGTWPPVSRWRRALSYTLWVQLWAAGSFVAGLAAQHYYRAEYLGLRDDLITNEAARLIVSGSVVLLPLAAVVSYHHLRRRRPTAFRVLLHWGLGKRLWLGLGFTFHLLIEIGMNVGTFVQVMWSTYPAWLRGEEIDAFWRWLPSRPARPGEHGRPVSDPGRGRLRRLVSVARGVRDRLAHRAPAARFTVSYAPDPASVRRAALLRCWDLCHRLEFTVDAGVESEALCIRVPGSSDPRTGTEAGAALTRVLPGLWPLAWARRAPGVGRLALLILDQR